MDRVETDRDPPADQRVVSDDLIALSNAYSLQVSAANRYWLACALLTFTVMGHEPGSSDITAFGVNLSSSRAMPLIALFLAVANIVYCSAHIQTYKAADIYRDFIKRNGLSKRQQDIAHLLNKPQFNRLAPFNHALAERLRWSEFFDSIKTVFDLLLLSVPAVGLLFSIAVVDFPLKDATGTTLLDAVYIALLGIAIPSSLIASFFLGVMVIRRVPR